MLDFATHHMANSILTQISGLNLNPPICKSEESNIREEKNYSQYKKTTTQISPVPQKVSHYRNMCPEKDRDIVLGFLYTVNPITITR